MRKVLGPVRLDVPVAEDEQRRVAGIPGLAVAVCQLVRQHCAYAQPCPLTQELLNGEILVRKVVQRAQSVSLVVVQVACSPQPHHWQVHLD